MWREKERARAREARRNIPTTTLEIIILGMLEYKISFYSCAFDEAGEPNQ